MARRIGGKPYDTAAREAPQFEKELKSLQKEHIEIILPFLNDKTTGDDFHDMIAICLAVKGSNPRAREAKATQAILDYFKSQRKERSTLYNDYRNISFNQSFCEDGIPVSEWLNTSDWNEWDR